MEEEDTIGLNVNDMTDFHPTANSPLVSVIIPAYNAEKFIVRTLNSVIDQTYRNIEVIVVDDGSQDTTAEIIRSIANQDNRIQLLQQQNAGVAAARNLAIQESKGEFIAPIDADDIWYPENIEKQVQCMLEADSSVGVVYSWSADIDEDDNLTGKVHAANITGIVFTTLLLHNFIANASSTLIRRTCFEKVGYYDSSFREQNAQGCEDWDLTLRIAEYYQFQVVPAFLVGYRKLHNSMSRNHYAMAKSLNLIWKSIEQKHPRIPAAIRRFSISSFYKYLAYENSRCGKHSNALLWLNKSLQEDWITPFFRLSFYELIIKSWSNLLAQSLTSMIAPVHNATKPFQQQSKKEQRIPTIEELNRRKFINLKSIAEKMLHQLASRIFGNSEDWPVQDQKN